MPYDLEFERWLRYLIPLPHEISWEGMTVRPPDEVGIRLREGAGAIERQAVLELERLFVEKTGVSPTGQGFTLLIGVVDEKGRLDGIPVDAGRLRALPHPEQAYLIRSEGPDRLLLAGLDERGVYYAVRTLCQLLEPALFPAQVTIPRVRVIDWPDMDERGLWNFPEPAKWIPWMASLKLNYGKMSSTCLHPVERGRRNRAEIDTTLYEEARRKAFRYAPYIIHLNFLHDIGLFQAYPELAGKGDGALSGRYVAHKQGNQHRVPCASQPLLVTILSEWLEDIAGQGVDEASCWLSERPAECGCSRCPATGQFVLESRAFVAAWQQVRRTYPDFRIRVFISTTTEERDYRVIAELPSEVKVERACADELERVLYLPRDLRVNPLLDYEAARGRWIASYDIPISANGRVDTPEFKVPHRSAHRIRDYVGQLVRRRYAGAYGMMAWTEHGQTICGFNIEALAEWSWNFHGRTEKEFAIAWATREGYRSPEAVGEWAELMGPVEFDVYDSDFPICYSWGKAIDMVRDRRRPYFGEGMFRYYAAPEDFDRRRGICDQALEIATTCKYDDLARETIVVRSYVELSRWIYVVAEQSATLDLAEPAHQTVLWASVERLRQAGTDNAEAVRTWRASLGPEPWHQRVYDAIEAVEITIREIGRLVEEQDMY
ncbi:MAG: hypothetical protein FJY97_13820 [candidate division Zixibacteria bacterium]|nr:hypothetical protein [candidate division Zixibacteria bacterium]